MTNATLLVELLTEELPPKALTRARATRSPTRIVAGPRARAARSTATRASTWFATPRRLGVAIDDVLDRAPDRVETKS